MQKMFRNWLWIGVIVGLTSCAQNVKDDSIIWDHEWKKDIYNLLFSEIDDVDHLRYWVKRIPEYVDGSPHQTTCIEVSTPSHPSRLYLANLHTYALSEVSSCQGDYWLYSNLINVVKGNKFSGSDRSTVADTGRSIAGDRWSSDDGKYWIVDDQSSCALDNISDICRTQSKHVRLVLNELFMVNESALTPDGRNMLVRMIEDLRGKPIESILVYGIADSSGAYESNRHLADARAKSVKYFLQTEGMRDTPIFLRGSVENGLPTAEQRITQRRFMIEMKFNYDEK